MLDRQVEAITKNEGTIASRYKRTITIGGDVSQFYGDHIVSTPGSSSIYD